MTEIVGIQFKNTSRVYYFAPKHLKFEVGEYAIVETVRGLELGRVIIGNRLVEDDDITGELKPVIRKATNHDIENQKRNEALSKDSFEVFKQLVKQLDLEMKPLYCEYTIDSSKLIFYYTAEERVDFRELLKLLTPRFRTRIELRQIGPREAARVIGGIGTCGREICCKTCLNNFDFVTMKMAKDQNMSLNTNKISGICGKLMCCIGYEHEIYQETKKILPNIGEMVKTPKCPCCKVVSVDYVKKEVSVLEHPEGTPVKYPYQELQNVKVESEYQDHAEVITVAENTNSGDNEDIVEQEPKLEEPNNQNDKQPKRKIYKPSQIKKPNNKRKNNKNETKK